MIDLYGLHFYDSDDISRFVIRNCRVWKTNWLQWAFFGRWSRFPHNWLLIKIGTYFDLSLTTLKTTDKKPYLFLFPFQNLSFVHQYLFFLKRYYTVLFAFIIINSFFFFHVTEIFLFRANIIIFSDPPESLSRHLYYGCRKNHSSTNENFWW